VVFKFLEKGGQNRAFGVFVSLKNPAVEVDDCEIIIFIQITFEYLQNAGFTAPQSPKRPTVTGNIFGIRNYGTQQFSVYGKTEEVFICFVISPHI